MLNKMKFINKYREIKLMRDFLQGSSLSGDKLELYIDIWMDTSPFVKIISKIK